MTDKKVLEEIKHMRKEEGRKSLKGKPSKKEIETAMQRLSNRKVVVNATEDRPSA